MHRALCLSCLLASSVVLASSPPPPVAASLEQPVTLVRGGAATVGKFIVVYQRVVNDSRCPENARCITAGTVKVRLAVGTVPSTPRELDLELIRPDRPPSVEQDGYRVTVLGVSRTGEQLTLKVARVTPTK